MKNLGAFKDSVINADYSLQLMDSAQALSKQLKETYKSMKIDFSKFNTDNDGGDVAKNPPAEIYEYQNFFLLEKNDGTVVLLDGFRRLLWYNSPDTPILVRTYKQKDLSNSQILTLLVNLNHFKFFSGSSYQERGFGLLLKTVFDIDITKFRDAFDAYLSSNSVKNDYGSHWNNKEGSEKIELIKDRILNPHFVDDMNFIAECLKSDCMVNSFFGALVYQKRKNKKGAFDTEGFLKLAKEDKVMAGLIEKFKKAGTNSSAKSMDAVNQIQQSYDNYFTLLEGGTVEKSYAEKVQECKELREKINKEKGWTKLTGHKDTYLIERVMWDRLKNKKGLNFKCIVMPEEISTSSFNSAKIPLKYGLNELVKFTELSEKHLSFGAKEMNFGFKDPETGASWKVRHNYKGYNGYGKKYTTLDFEYDSEISKKYRGEFSSMSCRYDIELWVDIPKEEWEKK